MKHAFHEFFAGSGLVSYGLSSDFHASWANDISQRKRDVYVANLGDSVFHLGDISRVAGSSLPDAQLSWASFPCQDLSLAGKTGGIHSKRSGLVWEWLRVLDEMGERAPKVVCLENVAGLVSSRNGEGYRKVHTALTERGYKVGAILVNASMFVPQSRPRVFVIATKGPIPEQLISSSSCWLHNSAIRSLGSTLSSFVWWNAEKPEGSRASLADVVEPYIPFDKSELACMIPESHIQKFYDSGYEYATAYRRTRAGKQVLEVRCDGVAGCLRTPAGGSSRQYLVHRGSSCVEIRLLTVREVARLMGAPDSWRLPGSYNDGYYAMGDAVAVPVATWLSNTFLRLLVEASYDG